MPLTFDDDPLLSPAPDGIAFTAYDGSIPIICRITREALVGIAGDHPDDNAGLIAIFLQHQTMIEAAAAAWHKGNGEPVVLDSGSVSPAATP